MLEPAGGAGALERGIVEEPWRHRVPDEHHLVAHGPVSAA